MNYYTKKNNQTILIFKNILLRDKRGHLNKIVNSKIIEKLNFKIKECQFSYNKKKNVFRGFYMQIGKFAERKLITLLSGKAIWFALDLRKKSKKFGNVNIIKIKKNTTIFIPKGFAHGSLSLSPCTFHIMADNSYSKKNSIGIRFDDKELKFNLSKKIKNRLIVSKMHNNYGYLKDIKNKI